jgi:hypothetical protein
MIAGPNRGLYASAEILRQLSVNSLKSIVTHPSLRRVQSECKFPCYRCCGVRTNQAGYAVGQSSADLEFGADPAADSTGCRNAKSCVPNVEACMRTIFAANGESEYGSCAHPGNHLLGWLSCIGLHI